MRALSVRQPWAELIARGKKKIEHRTWTVGHRGDLLVVSSASPRRVDPVKMRGYAAIYNVDDGAIRDAKR